MSRNVAMNANGIMLKGDYHQVLNNLALDTFNDEGGDRQGNGCVLCVLLTELYNNSRKKCLPPKSVAKKMVDFELC